jgi:hypothetical protein
VPGAIAAYGRFTAPRAWAVFRRCGTEFVLWRLDDLERRHLFLPQNRLIPSSSSG